MAEKLSTVRNKAKRQGIKGEINISSRLHKKYQITLPDGKIIHFGQRGYSDYIEHKDPERRQRYLARAKKIKDKNGKLTANDPLSPNYYAIRLLW